MRRQRLLIVLAVLVFAILTALFINDLKTGPYTTPATLGDVKLQLDIADSDEERVGGLSGRSNLSNNQGMLFVFGDTGSRCMWMKDMLISLDVLWLNENYEVVEIAQNISPETYPKSFCSSQPVQYFLELPAGFATKHRVQTGTQLTLQ